jgi:hypothetical protein
VDVQLSDPSASEGSARRRGRLLVGWLDERSAAAYGPAATARLREHGEHARAVVASRAPIGEFPAPQPWLDASYEARLREADTTIAELDRRLAWVNLDSLRVRQVAVELVDDAPVPLSHEDLAALTVPVTPVGPPVVAYDERAGAWVLRSDGGSLEVTGRYNGPVEGAGRGTMGFGFIVSAQPSRLEVLEVDGALVLVDGHHRALSLWRAGVRVAPALVRRAMRGELAGDDGVDVDLLLSSRPPRLVDYLDDEVAVELMVTPSTRLIVLQANELKVPVI